MSDDEEYVVELDESDCLCVFPMHCGGVGYRDCHGCGGDVCVCTCGGERECSGCADCAHHDDAIDFEEDGA